MRTLERVDAIVVHHTASGAVRTTLEDVRAWHLDRGFEDVGYHYLVQWDGVTAEVRQGRDPEYQGAHCRGWNWRSIGVCVVGSWERTAWSDMPLELRRVLVDLLGNLLIVYDLWPQHVLGHREGHPGHTVCPGFDPADLRAALERVTLPRFGPEMP